MGWPSRRPLWSLFWWGFAAARLKRTFCTFSLFYRGYRAGCSPSLGYWLTLPCYCPQCLWNLCTYLPNGSRRSYFFQLFSRPKVGLNPWLMLKFCQFAMSLHLPSKTLRLLFLPKLWKTCWRWFLIKFTGNCLKVSWNSPPFFKEDLLFGLIVA